MTLQEIIERVEQIKTIVWDFEGAHSMEDQLHQDVLAAIRDGKCDDPAECARVALWTLGIDFPRYCA